MQPPLGTLLEVYYSEPTRSLPGAYSELRRSSVGDSSMFSEAPKKHQKKHRFFDTFLAPFWLHVWSISNEFSDGFPLLFFPFSLRFFVDLDAISEPRKPPKWCSRAGAVLFFKFSPYSKSYQHLYTISIKISIKNQSNLQNGTKIVRK